MGTAYEYFAKRLALARWLACPRPPRRLLIAGLPEKYGSSLDIFQLAQDLSVTEVVVLEDRPWALEKCRRSLAAAQATGRLTQIHPQYVQLPEVGSAAGLSGEFDLCLGSEVLQRLDEPGRRRYVSYFARLAPAVALFVPNGDNPSHKAISGLSGLSLNELQALINRAGVSASCGYVDMPPFPPGLTRSAAQRERAASGKLEGFAMWALGCSAHTERFFPSRWRQLHSHMLYAFIGRPLATRRHANGG